MRAAFHRMAADLEQRTEKRETSLRRMLDQIYRIIVPRLWREFVRSAAVEAPPARDEDIIADEDGTFGWYAYGDPDRARYRMQPILVSFVVAIRDLVTERLEEVLSA